MARISFLAATLGLAAGCTQFPALDRTQTADVEAAEYPALVPIEPLIAEARSTPPDAAQTANTINGRLAGLRARANRLRGPVLSNADKRRLASDNR